MRFNNRKKKAPTALEEGDEGSPVRHKVTRDSMVFNNRSQANKALELTLVPAEDFICGCRDVLRSPVLLDKIRELVEGETCVATCQCLLTAVYPRVRAGSSCHVDSHYCGGVQSVAVCPYMYHPFQVVRLPTVALTYSACQ